MWEKAHKPYIYQTAPPHYSFKKRSQVWIRLQKTVRLMNHVNSHLEHDPVLLLGPVYYTHVTAHPGLNRVVPPPPQILCYGTRTKSYLNSGDPSLLCFPWKAFEVQFSASSSCSVRIPNCEAGLKNAFSKNLGWTNSSLLWTHWTGRMEAMACGFVFWLNPGTLKHCGFFG